MGSPFFSVIVPIYKVEKYLCQCVDSVLAQTFVNFEIILVDDGSPDRCPEICDEYKERDGRVKVVHKSNGGLSDARNQGINVSSGKYLMFLDSDDYWSDEKALEKIYHEIRDYNETADVIIFQAQLLYSDGTIIKNSDCFSSDFNKMRNEEALRYLVQNGYLIGSACSKVIRKNFLVNNNLFFKVGIKSEDIHWIFRVADAMPRYQYTDQYFYIYRKGRPGSITTTVDYKHLCQLAEMLEEFSEDYSFTNQTAKECILSLVAYQVTILMASIANLRNKKERLELKERAKRMETLLKYDIHPRVQLVNKVKKIVGFDVVMFLLGIYLKYRGR